MKYNFLLLAFFLLSITSYSQKNKLPDDLFDFSEENVKSYAWKNPDTKSKNNEFPDTWKNESAIFLYMEQLYESKNTSVTGAGVTYFSHYRIKLLDKAAVDYFSTIYYSAESHGNYSLAYCSRQKDFLGVKVIKPDGTEKIVKSEDFIKEDDKKKVAVPNLEVGDIIDYYLYTYDYWGGIAKFPNFYSIVDKFVLGGQYPVKYLKYQLLTDRNWNVKFSTGQHGPAIKEERAGIKGKDYRFTINTEDIPSYNRVIWNLPYQSSPYIKLYVKYFSNFITSELDDKAPFRTTELSSDKIIDGYSYYYVKDKAASNEYSKFKSYIKKKFGENTLSKERLLEEYYYYIRHHFINKHYVYDCFHSNSSGYALEDNGARYISAKEFTGHIIYGLDAMDIPYDLLVVMIKQEGILDDVLDVNETDYVIRANLQNPIYFYKPSVYTVFNKLPESIEGTKAYVLHSTNQKSDKLKLDTLTLPVTKAEENTILYEYNVAFDNEDNSKLLVKVNAQFNGLQMSDYKSSLIDYIDMIWHENDRYDTKRWGSEGGESQRFKVQMDDFIRSEGEKRKTNFEAYAKDQFEDENLKLTDYKTLSTGNEPNDNNLKISYSCEINDFVKKAGPDFILKIGKLLGGQITLDEKNQERNIDVYMNFARGYEYTIKVEIPAGYEVKGLDALNLDIKNSTGSMRSSAIVKNGFVEFRFSKYYNHNFEKKEKWGEMKEFITPATLLTSKEILFQKIKN
jgi:hypothetical protein